MLKEAQYEEMVFKWLEYDPSVSDLVVLVVQSLPKRHQVMKSAIENGDVKSFQDRVHSLKGTSGNFHMDEVYHLAFNMDRDLKARGVIDEIAFTFMQKLYDIIEGIPEEYYSMEVFEEALDGEPLEVFRVLVAAATEDECHAIRRMLLGQPLEVIIASNASEVIQRIEKEPYDILILDVETPAVEGEVVLAYLRDHPLMKTIYTIILTTGIEALDKAYHKAFNVDQHMVKPVEKKLMRETILTRMKMREMKR